MDGSTELLYRSDQVLVSGDGNPCIVSSCLGSTALAPQESRRSKVQSNAQDMLSQHEDCLLSAMRIGAS